MNLQIKLNESKKELDDLMEQLEKLSKKVEILINSVPNNSEFDKFRQESYKYDIDYTLNDLRKFQTNWPVIIGNKKTLKRNLDDWSAGN